MVTLTKIYTRGGDRGRTSLGDGTRVPKHHLRVEAYGTVDEANGAIGLARLHAGGEPDAMLARIQNDLFDLGADLCVPGDGDVGAGEEGGGAAALRIQPRQVERLEAEIDAMNASLAPLNSFVLPAGTAAAAHLHFARTVVRRAERIVVEFTQAEPVNPVALQYLNRLSDHLFVLARRLNADDGRGDVLWVPAANR